MEQKDKYNFEDLAKVIAELRGENGCPWDKVQTHNSLLEYLIEESYEVYDAIKKEDEPGICEELGDVLLQIMLHSQIAKENNSFSIDDVVDGISKKMIKRHPHVFGDADIKTEDELRKSWEASKKEEKKYKSSKEVLELIPEYLPALMRAYKVQKKSIKLGVNEGTEFDENLSQVKNDVDSLAKTENIKEQYAKLLYDVVSLGLNLKLNPELILVDKVKEVIDKI
jgi:tetrapyrrole methylase family protein/MazG family protein